MYHHLRFVKTVDITSRLFTSVQYDRSSFTTSAELRGTSTELRSLVRVLHNTTTSAKKVVSVIQQFGALQSATHHITSARELNRQGGSQTESVQPLGTAL